MGILRGQASALATVGSGASLTATWSVNPTAGNSILVFLQTNGTITSVVDNGTVQSTFTLDVSNTSSPTAYVYRANGISLPSSGSYTVTVTTTTATTIAMGGIEYSGMAPGAPAATNTGNGTSTSVSTGAATGVLLFGGFSDTTSLNPETITYTGPGTQQFVNTNGSGLWAMAAADYIGSGSNAHTWTLGDSVTWRAAVAAYNPAGSPSSFTPVYPGQRGDIRRTGPMALRRPYTFLQTPPPSVNVTANAGSAIVPAVSEPPTVTVQPTAGVATAPSTAFNPGVSVTVFAGLASVAVSALGPAFAPPPATAPTFLPYTLGPGGATSYYDFFIPFSYMTQGGLPANSGVKILQNIGFATFTSTQASYTFSNVPAFNHYMLFWNLDTSSAVFINAIDVKINNSGTAAVYNYAQTDGNGTTITPSMFTGDIEFTSGYANGTSGNSGACGGAFAQFNVPSGGHGYPCYNSLGGVENGVAGDSQLGFCGGNYTGATSITSITLTPAAGSIVSGGYVSLYGWS